VGLKVEWSIREWSCERKKWLSDRLLRKQVIAKVHSFSRSYLYSHLPHSQRSIWLLDLVSQSQVNLQSWRWRQSWTMSDDCEIAITGYDEEAPGKWGGQCSRIVT
jgi:hypothetical protein